MFQRDGPCGSSQWDISTTEKNALKRGKRCSMRWWKEDEKLDKGEFFIFSILLAICMVVSGMVAGGMFWVTGSLLLAKILFVVLGINLPAFYAIFSLKTIEADPPHIGQVTFLRRRLKRTKKEGLRFFPAFFFDFIAINVQAVNQDLPDEKVRVRDGAEVKVPTSLTWVPDPNNTITYLDNGKDEGVKNILADVVRQQLRTWAFGDGMTWEKMTSTKNEGIKQILRAIVGDITDEQMVEAMNGNGRLCKESLGIIIKRLNIGEIAPEGELAKAAERHAVEEEERRGESYEQETDLLKAQQIVQVAQNLGQNIPLPEALRIVMEWKATREGKGFTIPGLVQALGGFALVLEKAIGARSLEEILTQGGRR